jgi:hypothetical protein
VGPALQESVTDLIVALPGESELLGGFGPVLGLALSFDQHGDFPGDFVILMDRKISVFPGKGVKIGVEA